MGTERLSRRDVMKAGAAVAGLGVVASGLRSINKGQAVAGALALPVETDGLSEETIVRTTCALCASGCGLELRVAGGNAVKVEGNPLHPLNQGVCCLRGQTSLEVLYSPERLAHPRVQTGGRGSGDWKEISWDEALEIVAGRLGILRQSGKAHQVALLHGDLRGQMRAFVNRFMQVYGSPNVIGRESLAEQATRQAFFLTQGINGLPVYDLNNSSYVMTFGGNLLETSRQLIYNLGAMAFMRRGRPQRGKLVAVHPRLSLTGIKADEWVPIRPGTYGALALGMANVMINSNLYAKDFVRDFTFCFEDFQDAVGNLRRGFKSMVLEEYTLERTARITGVPAETIARLAGEFATNRPAVAVMPNETGELTSGNSLYTAMAVHALNALVGSIDTPGGVLVQRFPSVAPWPETELDGAALTGLAQPRLDGAGSSDYPLAISAWQELVNRQKYPIEAMLLLNANPAFETPQAGEFTRLLMQTPFVVSFSSTLDESAAHSDLILPADTFLEQWGDDFMEGCGYAGVSLRRPVVAPVHDNRNPGDVLLDLAQRLGGSLAAALPWKDYHELVQYRLSGAPLDPQKLDANGFWAEMVYFNAEPGSLAWKDVVGRDRLKAPRDGRFDLYSRELFALLMPEQGNDLVCLPHFELPEGLDVKDSETGDVDAAEYPFLLVTGGLITMNNAWQGIVPTLQESVGLLGNVKWDSWVEINPQSAAALGVRDGDQVWVESSLGRIKTIVRLYPGLWPNAVFMPLGQGHLTREAWGRSSARRGLAELLGLAPSQAQAVAIGVNPAQLSTAGSEELSGQAVTGPLRVRISVA